MNWASCLTFPFTHFFFVVILTLSTLFSSPFVALFLRGLWFFFVSMSLAHKLFENEDDLYVRYFLALYFGQLFAINDPDMIGNQNYEGNFLLT